MADADWFDEVARLEGVPSALAAARDAVDSVLRDRGLRATTATDTAESLLRGAAASATLAGEATEVESLRAGRAGVLAMNLARLNAELLGLVPVVQRAPAQAIARMHALAAAGLVGPESLGRPRGDDVAVELAALTQRLASPTVAPAIAVAAMAHADVASIRPFAVGNAVVGRALERLLLVARGVDPASVLVPESGHLLRRDGYEHARAGWRSGGPEGRRRWLLHASEALTASLQHSPVRTSLTRGTSGDPT